MPSIRCRIPRTFCYGSAHGVVRKTVMAIGYTIACVAMVGFAAGPQIYLPWLMAAGVGCGMVGSGIFAFTQTLAGPHAAGRWAGLHNGFANLSRAGGPAPPGFLVCPSGRLAASLA